MRNATIATILIVLMAGCPVGCSKDQTKTPKKVLAWTGSTGFLAWGRTSEGFFGLSTERMLETWKWGGGTLERGVGVKVPDILRMVPLAGDRYVACRDLTPGGPFSLVIVESNTGKVIKRWDPPSGWGYCSCSPRSSNNGKYAPIFMRLGVDDRFRVGVVDVTAQEMRVGVEFADDKTGEVREVAVSEDGRYVALAGWANGVLMADVSGGKVLWKSKPWESTGIRYAVFSSDGNTLYTADGGEGGVYKLDAGTGNVIHKWDVQKEGAYRMSCLAVSPDGAWLAAGSGPGGNVFLFKTGSDEKPTILPHGLSTTLIVSFSPDSNYLASVAGGQVKIWAVYP